MWRNANAVDAVLICVYSCLSFCDTFQTLCATLKCYSPDLVCNPKMLQLWSLLTRKICWVVQREESDGQHPLVPRARRAGEAHRVRSHLPPRWWPPRPRKEEDDGQRWWRR